MKPRTMRDWRDRVDLRKQNKDDWMESRMRKRETAAL